MNREDRRVKKTQKAIFQAFEELLENSSIKEMTINDIADKADLNRGTIYRHFTDKYDLLDSWVSMKLDDVKITLHKSSGGSTELRDMMYVLFNFYQKNYNMLDKIVKNERNFDISEHIMNTLCEYMTITPQLTGKYMDMDNEFVRDCIIGTLAGAINWWLNNGFSKSPEQMVSQVSMVFGLDEEMISISYRDDGN